MNSRAEARREADEEALAETIDARSILGRLVVFSVAILLAGQVAVAALAITGFEKVLKPQISQKAGVVGGEVADQIAFAVDDLGIPPEDLVGIPAFLGEILESNADIKYLLMLDPSSRVQYASGLSRESLNRILPDLPSADSARGTQSEDDDFINVVYPVLADGRVVTVLHVGVSKEYVRGRLSDLLYEAVTVIVVSLIVTLECLMFVVSVRLSVTLALIETILTEGTRGIFGNWIAMRPRDEIGDLASALNRVLRELRRHYEDFRFEVREILDSQIDRNVASRIQALCRQVEEQYSFTGGAALRLRNAKQIRMPLFLFMFAEELPRSFLPLFIARLSPTGASISEELLLGLPITLFMLAGMFAVAIGGNLADQFGARRVFLAGVVPATIGYVGTFLAQGYYDFVVWRVLSGTGYGLIFISAQAWVADNTGESNRAQGMGVFVGGVFAATICGPSIGGILADRIGFETVFLISAGLAVISGLSVYAMIDSNGRSRTMQGTVPAGKEWTILVSDARLLAVTVLAAIPGKLILSGFLFYLVPLYLSELGNRQSTIGWMIMIYGVSTLVCMPLASRFADRSGCHAVAVATGGMLASFGCLVNLLDEVIGNPSNAVMIAIAAVGVGHSLALTSQTAIVQAVTSLHKDIGQASAIGAYRLVERTGMVLGPIIAAALAASFGYHGAIVGMGIIVLVSSILYTIVTYLSGSR